jgi:GxxExxY protein
MFGDSSPPLISSHSRPLRGRRGSQYADPAIIEGLPTGKNCEPRHCLRAYYPERGLLSHGTGPAILVNVRPSIGDEETYAIIGAAMEVHRVRGCGFLEAVYRAALVIEMLLRNIPVETETTFNLSYKDRPLPLRYRADIVCFESVIVEVKASSALGPVDQAQAINYLRVSKLRRALVLNFGIHTLQYRRVVL